MLAHIGDTLTRSQWRAVSRLNKLFPVKYDRVTCGPIALGSSSSSSCIDERLFAYCAVQFWSERVRSTPTTTEARLRQSYLCPSAGTASSSCLYTLYLLDVFKQLSFQELQLHLTEPLKQVLFVHLNYHRSLRRHAISVIIPLMSQRTWQPKQKSACANTALARMSTLAGRAVIKPSKGKFVWPLLIFVCSKPIVCD